MTGPLGDERIAVDDDEAPDARFTFANERTFLAWNRTALALVAAGLAVAQFLRLDFEGADLILALPLLGLGIAVAVASYRRWQASERALWRRAPLPRTRLPIVLAAGVGAVAAVAAVLVLVDAALR